MKGAKGGGFIDLEEVVRSMCPGGQPINGGGHVRSLIIDNDRFYWLNFERVKPRQRQSLVVLGGHFPTLPCMVD